MDEQHEATLLLGRIVEGDERAAERLLPLIYDQLRAVAGAMFSGQKSDHTLQPTALVHEAYMRLIRAEEGYNGRAHFLAVASTAMRQILTDHARRRRAAKRGGGEGAISLEMAGEAAARRGSSALDALALADALEDLQALDARRARVVELRFFGGLTVDEIADVLGVSKTTVENDWRGARAWLRLRLNDRTDEAG